MDKHRCSLNKSHTHQIHGPIKSKSLTLLSSQQSQVATKVEQSIPTYHAAKHMHNKHMYGV